MTKCTNCRNEINIESLVAISGCPICNSKLIIRPKSNGGWELGSSLDHIPPPIPYYYDHTSNPNQSGLCTGGSMSGGAYTHVNFCPRCKTVLVALAKYCHDCGHKLSDVIT